MARSVIVAIEIHDARLFVGTGDVNQWAISLNAELKAEVSLHAPPFRSMARWPRTGTGTLQSALFGRKSNRSLRVINMEAGVDLVKAPHAIYVLDGTGNSGQRYIYSRLGWANKGKVDIIASSFGTDNVFTIRRGWAMWVPAGAGFGAGPRLRVRGQQANPFLTDGYNAVARRHESLKPIRQRFIYT